MFYCYCDRCRLLCTNKNTTHILGMPVTELCKHGKHIFVLIILMGFEKYLQLSSPIITIGHEIIR